MNLLILALLVLAAFLNFGSHQQWSARGITHDGKPPPRRLFARKTNEPVPELQLARFVRELALLLQAGRSGPLLWSAMNGVLDVTGSGSTPQRGRTIHLPTMVGDVFRATSLGVPTAVAIRTSINKQLLPRRPTSRKTAKCPEAKLWEQLAACFEICEISGAPLAGVLQRLAKRLEHDADAASLRATALAGPRATTKLLFYLPFLGLGLGILMGVDPLGILLGTPIGWACAVVGTSFVVIGRFWSGRLLAAAETAQQVTGSKG